MVEVENEGVVRVTSLINRGSGSFDKVAVVVHFAVRGVEQGLIFSALRIVYYTLGTLTREGPY